MGRRFTGMEKKVGPAVCKLFIRPKETHKRKSLIGPISLNERGSPVRAGPHQVHSGFPELGMAAFSNRRGQAGVRWH